MILRSGGATFYGFLVSNPGAWVDGSLLSPPSPGTYHAINTGPFQTPMFSTIQYGFATLLDTSTEGTGLNALDIPEGMVPKLQTDAGLPHCYMGLSSPGFGEFIGTQAGQTSGPITSQSPDLVLDDANLDRLTLGPSIQVVNYFGVTDAHVLAFSAGPSDSPRIIFNYDIVAFWWIVKDPSEPCRERRTSRLTLSFSQPMNEDDGGVYERLDPDDPDAAPTPVIDEVQPNHGNIAGGTTITVIGSGFGKDFDLQVGGVSCTDLTYVSQFKVTGKTPGPHAPGLVNVVLINADGAST